MAMLHQSNYAMQRNSKQQPGKNGPLKDCVTYCASRVTAPFPSLHQFHVNLCPTPCCTYIIQHSNNPINPRISPWHNNTKRSLHKPDTLCKQRQHHPHSELFNITALSAQMCSYHASAKYSNPITYTPLVI
jgi:hypothetical protein